MVLPALWFSVEVTQHPLPDISDPAAVTACKTRLKSHYEVGIVFAHKSQQARDTFAAANREYAKYVSSSSSSSCVAELIVPGLPELEQDVVNPAEAAATTDSAIKDALAAAGGVTGLFSNPYKCGNAGLTLVFNVGNDDDASGHGGNNNNDDDDVVDLVFGQHSHVWTALPLASGRGRGGGGGFSALAVDTVHAAVRKYLRSTTVDAGASMLSAR